VPSIVSKNEKALIITKKKYLLNKEGYNYNGVEVKPYMNFIGEPQTRGDYNYGKG